MWCARPVRCRTADFGPRPRIEIRRGTQQPQRTEHGNLPAANLGSSRGKGDTYLLLFFEIRIDWGHQVRWLPLFSVYYELGQLCSGSGLQ
jgi:hypothetical protein